MHLTSQVVDSPVGPLLALASDTALCALEFGADIRPKLRRRLDRWFSGCEIAEDDAPVLAHTRAWLSAYFLGLPAEAAAFPLDLRGTPFERRVWAALLDIPPGTTTSYGAIATSLGVPGAARAVGLANGANPVSIIVPCHRVVGAGGGLTGYGGGLDRKKWLLEHERRWRTTDQPGLF